MAEQIRIELTTNNNSAFADDRDEELVKQMRGLADRIENGWCQHGGTLKVYDTNGNPFGTVTVFDDGEDAEIPQDCAEGMHSWVNDPTFTSGNCGHCGEPYDASNT